MEEQVLPEQSIQQNQLDQIEARKAKFYKTIRTAGLLAVLGIVLIITLITIIRVVAKSNKTFIVPQSEQTQEEQPTFPEPEEDPDVWNLFKSDIFMFSVKYPHDDDFRELETLSEDSTTYQISFKDTQPPESIGTESIESGYFVKITPLEISSINTFNAASVKRENFINTCPTVADISVVFPINIAGIPGDHFTARNCNSDYLIAYVKFRNYMFEIIQAHKGDLGYKQAYKTTAEQIVSSIRFIEATSNEEIPPTMTYIDPLNFSVEYPSYLNKDCCDVPKPPVNVPSKRIVLAESDNTNAVGFYTGFKDKVQSFNDFIEQQKQILIDEHTVIKGGPPQGTQENVTIGDLQGISLKGYSWEGNDLTYFMLKHKDNNRVLVISKTNISEDIYQSIISSLKIY